MVIYLRDLELFITACEGTGDNLLEEDIEQGYVDYIMTNTYKLDGYEFEELDGGQCMTYTMVRDMETEEFVETVLAFHGYKSEDYKGDDYIIIEN